MSDPVCLIVNPSAGGGRAARVAPEAERQLRGRGLEVRRTDTRDLGHARELAREAAAAGERIVAVSGDGLIGVLADELRALPGAVLGLVPGGRGNDLARVLGIPDDAAAAAALIAEGFSRPVDLGLVESAGSRRGVRRHRFGRFRQRRQQDRQRSAIVARRARVRIRRDARARRLEAGPLRDRARSARRAPRVLRLLGRRRELEGLRRRDDGRTRGAARRRHAGGRRARERQQARLPDAHLSASVFKGTHVELPCVHVFRAREIALTATGRSRCTPTAIRSARCLCACGR